MAIIYKTGVSGQPSIKIQAALNAASNIFDSFGVALVVTSLRDGTHMRGSLHASGNAVDLRRHDLDAINRTAQATNALKSALGNDYDVILESDHIHVEYDPKAQPGAQSGGANGETIAGLGFPVLAAIAIGFFVFLRR